MSHTEAINHSTPRAASLLLSSCRAGRRAAVPEARPGDEMAGHAGLAARAGVDDAPDVAEMLGIMMRCAGYEVETALSAEDSLDLARRAASTWYSDIGMPG